ncbi:MAG: PLP-dependent aminotransferase family protein [Parvibaculaceae bacterium]
MNGSAERRAGRPAFARWLQRTNNITQQFLAIGGQADFVSLAGGLPAAELYPVEEMRAAADRALTRWGSRALEYGPVEGFPALRGAVAERVSRLAGRRFGAENILITTGAMQGLDLLGKVFVDAGDRIVTQFPTYLGALDAWRPREPSYVRLEWGLDGAQTADVLRTAKFAYTVPNYSNPTGVLVPAAERAALLRKARTAGTWIIEDDPYLPLQIDGPPGPGILALEAMENGSGPYRGPVVYLGTLSKSVVPGLRVGWMVAPADLIQTLALAKQSTDLSSSMLTHAIALDFMESGFEESHVPRTVDVYRGRRDTLVRAADERLARWFEWEIPPGGMFVWMRARRLPGLREIDTGALYRFALEEKVAFVPSSVFDFDGNLRSAMRVNFTRSAPDVIVEGIRRLGRAVERYLASNSDEAPFSPDSRP